MSSKDNEEKPDFSKNPKEVKQPIDPKGPNPHIPPQHQPPGPHK